MANLIKTVCSFDDGSTVEFDAAPVVLPVAEPTAEQVKEAVDAAVDSSFVPPTA